jgi:hypothetical protein
MELDDEGTDHRSSMPERRSSPGSGRTILFHRAPPN